MSLQKKAISSVKWTTLQTIVVGIVGLISLVIKARFLSPEEFAYVAIITIIIGLFHLLESFGISQAIIQRDRISQKESSSLFFFNILFCIILAGLLILTSPLIAILFDLPYLEYYLPIVSIIVILTGPTLLFRAFLEKNMYFKHLSLIAIARNVLTLISLTLFLVFGYGVAGVIYGQIFGILFAAFAIIYVAFYTRSIKLLVHFKLKELLPFLRFGIFVSSKQLLTYLAHRLDELVIGYFLAPEILGIYHFGKNMLEKLRALITSSFGKVLFPVLSKLKNNRNKLSKAYQKISQYIAFGSFPIFTGIAVTAHLFVPLIFGVQWENSIIVFQVFSISMIFLVLTANVSSSLLYSVNKPDVVFYIDIVTNVVYFASLMLFASYGVIAILITYSCFVIFKTLILQFYANKQLVQNFSSYIKGLVIPTKCSLIMGIIVLIFQNLTYPAIGNIMLLIISIILGGGVFILLSWYLANNTLNELKNALLKGEISR